jgi:tRNA threonylcarbamoyladenosine biosynthesis protein TsaE
MKPFISHNVSETQKFAQEFSQKIKKGDLIALIGDLGAGKTHFVQGLFQGLGGDSQVVVHSPTFTLLHEYPTPKGPLYHFDLYRISSFREFENLDFNDYLQGFGIAVVEWADRIPELKASFTWSIDFQIKGENQRNLLATSLK